MAVDTAEGVISNILADFADGRDSRYLLAISMQVQNRLKKKGLKMTDLLADAGCSTAQTIRTLKRNKKAFLCRLGSIIESLELLRFDTGI